MSDSESNQLEEKMETNQDAGESNGTEERIEDEKMEVPPAESEWEAPTGLSNWFLIKNLLL